MEPHGDYKIKVLGNVVHTYPVGGFNSEGIDALHDEVVAKAPAGPWALFEHTDNTAGLTPDAVDAIVRSYKHFETINCVAIALELSSTWQGVFEASVKQHINIPVFLAATPDTLEQSINEVLRKHHF